MFELILNVMMQFNAIAAKKPTFRVYFPQYFLIIFFYHKLVQEQRIFCFLDCVGGELLGKVQRAFGLVVNIPRQ